jgi:hypothetical protein
MKKLVTLLCGALLSVPLALAAQENVVSQESAIRLYLDCQADCDTEFLRTEITFVSYVRDRADADVHLLITAEGTGGGGRRYILNFIGSRAFEGVSDTLLYTASQNDTEDLRRRGLSRTIKMGLMRFVASSPLAPGIEITYEPPMVNAEPTGPTRDPWNYWVFRMNGGGNLGGEARRSNYSMNGSLRASRTTEDWKFNVQVNARYSESRTQLNDSTEFFNDSREYNGSSQLVKSLGDHLSAGLQMNANSSIFSNEEISVRVAPALEYNFYPYTEATRRQFTVTYTVGLRRVDYREQTIYFKTAETLSTESLEFSYGVQQPWGDAGASINASHYFHNTKFYRLQFNGDMNVRLFRGFSLNFGGSYSRIRDQLSLPLEDASEEEILVQRQQLQTNYRYNANIGISYSFGSIFNNVVNPRFN